MKNKIAIGFILSAIVGMALMFPCAAFAEDVVIITNSNAPANSLSINDIKNIFLSKKTQWDDGSKIDFVILNNSQTHEVFLKTYLQKTSSQYQRYFRSLVFTGKGKSPKSFGAETDLVGYVASTEGAIGYVSPGTTVESVKKLTIN